ncbi:MAG: ABC transporter substrate-binding protein [Thermoplasmata archaeon]
MEPKWIRVSAVIVALITVGSAVGVYHYYSTQSTGCGLQSTNPLIFDQAEQVHTLDPDWAYSTPDWGAVQQVYQALVMYNHSSTTNFSGELAKNWTESADGLHWNFTLQPDIYFSNGDPVNAYVMWFSLYRTLAMFGSDQYLLAENFWLPNVSYYSPSNATSSAENSLLWDLNNFNFLDPSAGPANETAVMSATNQSFQVINPSTIELNLGFGYIDYGVTVAYTYLLAEISSVGATAVDPKIVQENGGVVYGSTNAYLENHMMGTGPFMLSLWAPGSSITFAPSTNYWATTLASAETWNNNIQPARSSIEISFQEDPAINVENLKTGAVAGASFAYLGPDTVHDLAGTPCVKVEALSLPYSTTNGGWWLYMNQTYQPFNNLSVRAAITHAINVSQIITEAFGGYAYPWVGPVPPGYPDYNTANLPDSNSSYNLNLAMQEMNASPWPIGHPYPKTINFVYVGPSPDFDFASYLIQQDLAKIGITINPEPLPLNTYYTLESYDGTTNSCVAQTSANGGPYPFGWEFYTSDWISPDDWTLNNVWQYGSANECMGGYNNSAMNTLSLIAAGEHNATKAAQDYATMETTMVQNYTDVWLVIPNLFAVYNVNVQGLVPNPIGSCLPAWNLECNTEYAT